MVAWSASETLTGVSSIAPPGPKGKRFNAYMSGKISGKKKAYECSETESQRERGYPHIAAIMRLLSTLTEPGAFIQGGDVPWRKEHCTLSKKKILNSTQGNKLGWHAGLVHSDKSKMPLCVCTCLKTNCVWGH